MKFKDPICRAQFSFQFVLLALLLTTAQSDFAQTPPPPLNFANNFFVTGDYIVAGAYGMTSKFTTINGVSYAVGAINVPDKNPNGVANPGIQGQSSVPPGGQVVAALLYWQTAEKVGVTAGGSGSGQNGFFRPVLSGGPVAPGYAIQGTSLTGSTAVAWSSGGCSGSSTGKLLKTYRADVAGALPVDANGNPVANGSFEVRLQGASNGTPITLGATLVIIYRIPAGAGGPKIPLHSIVIYDGDFAQSTSQLTMTQKLQGFYDADHNPVSRLTHIVGNGQSNKFQTVYLSSENGKLLPLPFLYGNKLPAFPGWYGNWDNPTWQFTNPSTTNPGVMEDDSFTTTQVKPASSMQGCVSWGAVIVSTTVKNTDIDGILDSWKSNNPPGYCDASINNGTCAAGSSTDPGWVDLTGAAKGQKDIFLQYDYLCSTVLGPPSLGQLNSCKQPFQPQLPSYSSSDYSFDPRLAIDPATNATAIDKVVDAFENHRPFKLHAIPGNAIQESQSSCAATDTDPKTGSLTCPFPNQPGTVGFREGLSYIKNQNIDPNTGLLCTPGATGCGTVPVFQHGKKDSYHYALFSHGVGLQSWFLSDPTTLTSVKQAGNTVTFTTPTPHGIAPIAGDSCKYGRVTVVFAITNPSVEGTYCVLAPTNPPNPNQFQITVGGSPTTFTYTAKTDPNLSVANGQVTSMSGFSDVGGQNSVVSLGYGSWGPPKDPTSDGNKWQVKAGTFMHELGHTLGLTHGGTFYKKLGSNDYTPTFEVNCKPNVQSVMSYLFQVDLLEVPGQPGSQVVDFSGQALPTLTESTPPGAGILSNATYAKTAWYQLTSFAGGTGKGSHCDGTPLLGSDKPTSYVSDFVSNLVWNVIPPGTAGSTGSDINFNGAINDTLNGHDEWDGTVQGGVNPSPGVDLQQVSAVGTISTIGLGGEAGALHAAGGGGALHAAGGGGALHAAGGGGLTNEINHEQANSYARPPRDLTITQEQASPRLIDLSWFVPTFGQIVNYNIYRSAAGGAFAYLTNVPGTQTTFEDTVSCNLGGYSYKITAVVKNDMPPPATLESVASNIVPASGEPKLTGCYTVTNFSSAASAIQGTIVPITWTLTDDFFASSGAAWSTAVSGNLVSNMGAITLVAIGPGNTRTTLISTGTPTAQLPATFTVSGGVFTFNWDTDPVPAGSYSFELDLDGTRQVVSGTSPLQLAIDINDQDTLHITTVALPDGIVGNPYGNALTEEGGTAPFIWKVTGLPSGISQQPASSPTLSGTACMAGPNAVMATVTDSAVPKNSGSQGFTLQINKASTTTGVGSNANPSVFQQTITFTVTVTPQYGCIPSGNLILSDGGNVIAPNLVLSNGSAMFNTAALSVGTHSITAQYQGDSNFNASNSAAFLQTVNPARTATSLSSIVPSTVFVGQPITISYAFGVVSPGAGAPIAPSGTVMVSASDGSGCLGTPVLGGGMCTLSPAPQAAGNVTFTITYPGDNNFVTSGTNGNYNVYQLVFTAQPNSTGAGLIMTPAVQVTAEDSMNMPLTTFTGSLTVAIGAGPGTLSGTTTRSAVGGVATFDDLSINKIANGYTLVASPAGGVPDSTSSQFNIDTFYVDGLGHFGTLDLASGVVTQIGSGTLASSTGLDLTPSLQLYEYNTSNQLMQIAPSTGVGTPIGTGTLPNPSNTKTGALTTGSYFAIDEVTGILYSINLTTGATTSVGPTSAALVPAGCPIETSLSGSANMLYYTVGSSGVGTGCTPSFDTLYVIDPTSEATTTIVPVTVNNSGVNTFVGSAFDNGTLYGFTADGKEYTIDPASGVATFVVNTSVNLLGAGGS